MNENPEQNKNNQEDLSGAEQAPDYLKEFELD